MKVLRGSTGSAIAWGSALLATLMGLTGAVLVSLTGCVSNDEFKKSPREAASYNAQLGIEYMKRGNLQAAREKIERALKQDPQSPDVQYNAGLLYQRLGENDKADRHYEAALRLKPDDPEKQNTYGVFLCSQKRAEEGEKLLLKAARNPTYRTPALAYKNIGTCLQDAGRPEEAQVYLEKAYALDPRLRPPTQTPRPNTPGSNPQSPNTSSR